MSDDKTGEKIRQAANDMSGAGVQGGHENFADGSGLTDYRVYNPKGDFGYGNQASDTDTAAQVSAAPDIPDVREGEGGTVEGGTKAIGDDRSSREDDAPLDGNLAQATGDADEDNSDDGDGNRAEKKARKRS